MEEIVTRALDQLLTDKGAVGAIAVLSLAALTYVYRGLVQVTDRFIEHLQGSEARDIEVRERQIVSNVQIAEAVRASTVELREHDRRTVELMLETIRPASVTSRRWPGEDTIHAVPA